MHSKDFYNKLGKSQFRGNKQNLDALDKFLLKNFSCKNKKILDLGCGKGYLSFEFAKKGNVVFAVDESKSMLDYAKTKNKNQNINYILSDFKKVVFNKKFDLILAINSLVHVKNVLEILKKIRKYLEEDGQFVLCFPHPIQDIKYIKDYSKEQIIQTKTKFGIHKQYFRSINFYCNSLIRIGFRIIKVHEFPLKNPLFFIIEAKLNI